MNYPDVDDLHEGKFTDGNPATGIEASISSAATMNSVYDELIAVVQAGGLSPDYASVNQVAQSIQQQIQTPRIFQTSGEENNLTLISRTGLLPVVALHDYDQFTFPVVLTNTDQVTIQIDGLARLPITNITGGNQLLKGALATLTYLDNSFFLVNQINPKTGNHVNDIGELKVNTTNVLGYGEIAFDGAELSRTDHPIFWAKIQATSNLIDQITKDAESETYAGYYGTGDGTTTFTLPNLGGEFIRMADNGRGVDEDTSFGRWQDSENKLHGHYISHSNNSQYGIVNARQAVNPGGNNGVYSHYRYGLGDTYSHYSDDDAMKALESGSEEARPRNIAYFAKTRV